MSGPHFPDETETFGAGRHHVMPVAYEDVKATLLAHTDDGTGYCRECGELDPCGIRTHHEAVLRDLNRRTP